MNGEGHFVANRSRARLAALLALLVILGMVALFLPIPNDGSRFLERLEFGLRIVGGIAIIVTLFKLPALLASPAEVTVSDQGIWYRPWSDQTVPWEGVSKVTERKINVQRVLCIHLKDPGSFAIKRRQRIATKLNKASGDFGDMNIMIQMTDRTIDELKAAIAPFHNIDQN